MIKSEKFSVIYAGSRRYQSVGQFRSMTTLVLVEIAACRFTGLVGNIKRETVGEKILYYFLFPFAHAVVYFSFIYRSVINLVSGFFKEANFVFCRFISPEHGYNHIGVKENFSHDAIFWSGYLCEARGYKRGCRVNPRGRPKDRILNQQPALNYYAYSACRNAQARLVSGRTWIYACGSLRRAAFSIVQWKDISVFVS